MNGELLNVSYRMKDSKAKELRRQGYVPGVIYGFSNEAIPVIFDTRAVENFLRNMNGNNVFEVSLEGDLKPVRIKHIQRDPVNHKIIHIDLQNVNMDKKLKAKVPVKYEGLSEIKRKGMILQHQKDYIEVEGMAADIPSHLTVSLHNISGNQSIRVQDVEFSGDISIIDSMDEIIASVIKPSNKIDIDSGDSNDKTSETHESENTANTSC